MKSIAMSSHFHSGVDKVASFLPVINAPLLPSYCITLFNEVGDITLDVFFQV